MADYPQTPREYLEHLQQTETEIGIRTLALKPLARVTLGAEVIGLLEVETCRVLAEYLEGLAVQFKSSTEELRSSMPFNVAAQIMELDFVKESHAARVTMKADPVSASFGEKLDRVVSGLRRHADNLESQSNTPQPASASEAAAAIR